MRKAGRWLYYNGEYRLYILPADLLGISAPQVRLERDSMTDLLTYVPASPGHVGAKEFVRNAASRMSRGEHVYTYVERGRLLHYSWLIDHQQSSGSEFGTRTELPAHSSVLYDDYTHPASRGRGLHTASLLSRVRDAVSIAGSRWVVIGVMADNAPSRHNIEKVGFRHFKSIFKRVRLGRSVCYEHLLARDGISDAASAKE